MCQAVQSVCYLPASDSVQSTLRCCSAWQGRRRILVLGDEALVYEVLRSLYVSCSQAAPCDASDVSILVA